MSGFITDLVPSAFSEGLEHWSPGNGTPGSTTYDTDPDGVYVPADADFGGCLEVIKGNTDQAIRYMGETPIDAQRYIEVSARVKVIAGILPAVRIAAYPVDGSNAHVTGLLEAGPSTTIGAYGEVVVVKAIIGTGARDGVDMVWTAAVDHAHIGLDIVGPNAAIVRIDDLDIRDVTHHYQSQLIEYVNVVDFGALGDGSTDNVSAFEAADAAANGRTVLVPEGVFALGDHVTLESKARFIGQVTIPADKTFTLAQNFELNSYTDAFGSELIGFEKAFQSLINAYTHESLDLCGRRVEIDRPIDMQAAVNTRDSFAIRRVVRNGQFYVTDSPAWDSDVYSSVATYSKTTPLTLTNVQNIAQIPIGSLVTGTGVGREIYVRSVDVLAQEITL
ncbi:MAG: glycosyl hydrolase family 28-related protein, partial [Halocynthiibacter sp.]